MNAIQVSLNDDILAKIEDIKEIVGTNNRSRVISQGITLYHDIMKSIRDGDRVIIERKNGKQEIVSLIIC